MLCRAAHRKLATSIFMDRPYSVPDLRGYSAEHVAYEIDMFFGLVEMLSHPQLKIGGPSVAVAGRVNNALIESFGVHLRNLLDFLYFDEPQPTDVVAGDYCRPGAWKAARPAMSTTLNAARSRSNKELAHLTTQRISGILPGKKWAFVPLADEIRPLLQLFCDTADPTTLAPEARAAIR